MAMGEYANAAESFQAAAYLRPDFPKFLWQLAAAQAAAASYYSAIANLEKALAMQPDYLPAQMALVRLRQRTHRLQEGLELAREIQQQRPQNPQGYMLEGDIHMTAKEFEKAAKSYTESYARKKTPEIATKLFQAYWREGDRQTALESLEEWLAERPEDLKARKLLAQAYLLVDHPDAVIERDQAIVEGELGNAVALNKSSEVEKYSIIDTAKSLLDSASSYNNSFDSNGDPFDPSDPAYRSFKDIQKDLNALDGISQLDPADLITEFTALRNIIVGLPGEANTSSGFVPWPIGTEWIRTPRTVYPRIRQQ